MFSKKKKLGLALGSGGAKGMAHIGALRALEEMGLRFSAVAGTSIGSIVGALYAKGYSSKDMAELLSRLDYKGLAMSVLIAGSVQPARRMLDDILDESEFSELKIPFAAVATDAESGEEVVLDSGNVASAVLASGAMPPFFKGVDLGGKTLVDGAFANAVPGDVAKKLGASFVVGISLSPAKDYEKTFFLTRSGEKKEICQRGIGRCDFLLAPDLSAYSAASVTGAAEMYDIGYECAMRACDDLMRALRAKKISV